MHPTCLNMGRRAAAGMVAASMICISRMVFAWAGMVSKLGMVSACRHGFNKTLFKLGMVFASRRLGWFLQVRRDVFATAATFPARIFSKTLFKPGMVFASRRLGWFSQVRRDVFATVATFPVRIFNKTMFKLGMVFAPRRLGWFAKVAGMFLQLPQPSL